MMLPVGCGLCAEAGSESPAVPEKGEVRAGDTVSVRREGGGAGLEASLSVCGAAAEVSYPGDETYSNRNDHRKARGSDL